MAGPGIIYAGFCSCGWESDYDYDIVRDLKFDMTRHPFYDQVSDGNGVPPYVWGEADLAVGSVRVLDPSYAGELTVLPKANGVLLEVEE